MKQPNKQTEPIKTVLVISTGMLALYLWKGWDWLLYISIGVSILGLMSDYLANKIDYLWAKLAWVLSFIVPNILLSAVFFLFLTPIAILSRIFGEKNPLSLKNTNDSLFKNHDRPLDKESFEKPW